MPKSRATSRRPEQVAETVRQVLAEALTRGEIRDPRVGFVTVTGVRVTNDLSHARVLVSCLGEPEDRERSIEGLKSAAKYLRARLGKTLATRVVPELHFEPDDGLARAARIDQLLAELHREPEGS
ncbi:MAG TPA: 30S ribosome-binding factor RbfA [Gemmatimonadales bacterium]|nr:30S ribosome-binding factor RbfA [Gemmatimonadales bacterium]